MAKISPEEEEFRKLSIEMRLLEQSAEMLQQRINMLTAAITDLSYALITLESVEKEKENSELLVPIGGNSYLKAKLAAPDKAVMGIGAGISVEKTLQDAKAMVTARLEELEKSLNAVQQQFTQIIERINVDRNRAESLVAKLRERKASSDV